MILHTLTTLDEAKSKHAGLAQEIGFWLSIIADFAVAGTKVQQHCAPAEKKRRDCNIDL
jgi:hypothetical protein